jgi:hypothetical protein
MAKMMKWFSYDPETGIEFHETEEEAKRLAEECLDEHRNNAVDGWSEDVYQLCWGEIKESTDRVSCKPAPEDSEFDEMWEFELRPLEQKLNHVVKKSRS